jgi:hypothetical protein
LEGLLFLDHIFPPCESSIWPFACVSGELARLYVAVIGFLPEPQPSATPHFAIEVTSAVPPICDYPRMI